MKTIRGLKSSWNSEWSTEDRLEAEAEILKSCPLQVPNVERHWMSLDKNRLATTYPVEHQWRQAVISDALERKLAKIYPDELVSYRKGLGPNDVFRDIRGWLDQNRKIDRTMRVVRWDIKSYCDSIPLSRTSHLWTALEQMHLKEWVPHLQNELRAVVTATAGKNEPDFSVFCGVSFGSCLTPPLLNLYLLDFDSWIKKQFPLAFYRRFGDDSLLLLPSAEADPIQLIITQLKRYDLTVNESKTQSFVLHPSGFQSRPDFEYLGRSVSSSGLQFITRKKTRTIIDLWTATRRRIREHPCAVDLNDVWKQFTTLPELEELFIWVDDAKRVKSLSDRLWQMTAPKRLRPNLYQLWAENFRK